MDTLWTHALVLEGQPGSVEICSHSTIYSRFAAFWRIAEQYNLPVQVLIERQYGCHITTPVAITEHRNKSRRCTIHRCRELTLARSIR